MKKILPWLLLVLLVACESDMPAGFWARFKKQHQTFRKWSSAPNGGGYYLLQWKSTEEGTFQLAEVTQFASQQKWVLSDTVGPDSIYMHDVSANALLRQKPVYRYFRQLAPPQSRVYQFATPWTYVSKSLNDTTTVNGFIAIDPTGKEMALLHVWGE